MALFRNSISFCNALIAILNGVESVTTKFIKCVSFAKPNQITKSFNEKRFEIVRLYQKPDAAHTPRMLQIWTVMSQAHWIRKNRVFLLCCSRCALLSIAIVCYYDVISNHAFLLFSLFVLLLLCMRVMRTSYWKTCIQYTLLKKKYYLRNFIYLNCAHVIHKFNVG